MAKVMQVVWSDHALQDLELELLVIDSANRQDGPVSDPLRQMMHNNRVYGDRAYKRPDAEHIE